VKIKKYKIEGEESELGEYFVNNLVKDGHLEKYKDGYR